MKKKPIKKVKKVKSRKRVKPVKTVEPCGCGVYIPDSQSYPSSNYFDYTVKRWVTYYETRNRYLRI